MRLLICGGRNFNKRTEAFLWLDDWLYYKEPVTLVMHGDATGADRIGAEWAKSRGIPVEAYPADWEKLGRAAGPCRNREMLRSGRPDVVVAFEGGRGTAHMVRIAKQESVTVFEVELKAAAAIGAERREQGSGR